MKKIFSLVLCLSLLLGITTVFAEKEVEWRTLYDAKMDEIINEYKTGVRDDSFFADAWDDSAYYFALLDINFDGVPELYHTLCSYFEFEPDTDHEYEEVYYIKEGKVEKASIQAEQHLRLLPMYCGRMEEPGELYNKNSRWQFVLRNMATGEVCFVTNDSYSGFAEPDRRYDKLTFDSETGVLISENLLFQEVDDFAYMDYEVHYLIGYEYIAHGAYNTYSWGEYNIENWKPGYIAPKVTCDGEFVAFDTPPVIVNGRTLVPVRRIAEALGATIGWDDESQTVIITKGENTVVMVIGQKEYTVNGRIEAMDVPAQLMSGRTMIPARALSEGLNCQVGWDEENQEVMITQR